jgi:hypothetical protein
VTINLLSPLGGNFIKDFPFQNAYNMDLIDAYAGPNSLNTHSLGTYTPQLIGSTTNPNLSLANGGFIRGFYYKIFDQVFTWGEFRFGTTGAVPGSGFYSVTLPFTASTGIGGNPTAARGIIIGNAYTWDANVSGGRFPCVVQLKSSTELDFALRMGQSNEEVSNSTPFVWDNNDGMMWGARYKAVS